ncbi:MAG: hypothetical protein JW866_07195 [Ignavibacteriales bacterium]|nr:hypothetical protein [Ignavibacteriales bacterium]
MKIILPRNIFSSLLLLNLPKGIQKNIEYLPSSLILKNFIEKDYDIALVPTCDVILSNEEFFISKKYALSFDGKLGNSYFYYGSDDLKNLYISGDMSKNEVLLSKILYIEKYDIDVEIFLNRNISEMKNKNILLVGDENFKPEYLERGISLPDYFAELVDYPYVNYLFVAKNKDSFNELSERLQSIEIRIEDNLKALWNELKIDIRLMDYFKQNFNSVYFELTDNEIAGVNEMIKLMFYYGQIKDIKELKYY